MYRTSLSDHPPTVTTPRIRALTGTGTVLSGLLLLGSVIWLLLPEARPLADTGTPLDLLLGGPDPTTTRITAGIAAAITASTLVAGIAALTGRVRGAFAPVVVLAGAVASLLALLGLDALIISGYTFAFLIPVAAVALIVALGLRRPVTALVLAAVLAAGIVVAFALGFPLGEVYAWFFEAVAAAPIRFSATLALTLNAGIWMLWAAVLLTRRMGALGAFAARHRVILTVAAACCAIPYTVARLSWLTPWPVYGGNTDMLADDPHTLVLGLMLGGAILLGGILTLGLILPWGTRIPRWVPVAGGRPVPVAAAVVPASIVTLLFSVAGVQMIVEVLVADLSPLILLVVPLWLWGPLLGLATWGYAHHRKARP